MVRVRGYVLLHQSKKWYDWEGGEYYTLLPKYKTLLFSHTSKRKGREGKGKKSTDPSPLQLLAKRLPRERGRGRGKMERGRASLILPSIIPLSSSATCEAIAKGREGKGGKGREREGKGGKGKEREGKGREGKRREGKGKEGKGR